jgi:hypothetical protein
MIGFTVALHQRPTPLLQQRSKRVLEVCAHGWRQAFSTVFRDENQMEVKIVKTVV